MGVFDSRYYNCPHCNGNIEFQSRGSVSQPDINFVGEQSCCEDCGKEFMIVEKKSIAMIEMY